MPRPRVTTIRDAADVAGDVVVVPRMEVLRSRGAVSSTADRAIKDRSISTDADETTPTTIATAATAIANDLQFRWSASK